MFGLKLFTKPKSEAAGEVMTARLNARVQPIDRGEYFEDPLDETLKKLSLGAVTGGGTQLADEPAGIEFVDLEIVAADAGETTLQAIIARLEQLGAPKGSKLIVESTGAEHPFGAHEGMAIYLNGADLPKEIYVDCDVNHVIAELDRLMGERGKFKGYWEGSKETALYCYGPSFAEMRAAVEPLLAGYPLCRHARVEQIA
ncbi:MAG TPA: hypothetical protein PKM48_00080 [Parvularculaceae bacterium]|nr:hypothetical protein [Parvularculaceae bacterium]HNS85916.1 hypothetical protein [Parvularculaceae bacterium]